MLMNNSEHHNMVVAKRYENGAEEWVCPTCGRRFMLQWPPEYKRIVLEPGDENAIHTGGNGGVSMSSAEVQPSSSSGDHPIPLDDVQSLNEASDRAVDDAYLGPWADFIDTLDL